MKNQTAQIQIADISIISRVFLFLVMMLFVKGSMAQSGYAWVNNTSNLYIQTSDNSSVSKNAASYVWAVPTGVTIFSVQGTNPTTEGTGTVTPLKGAPSYTWTFGSGSSFTKGQDTTSIVVSPGNVNDQINCTKNSCGSSAAVTLAGREAIKQ